MIFKVLLPLLICLGVLGENKVEMLTEKFARAMQQGSMNLPEFYDQESVTCFNSELPAGGIWKGDKVALFYKRFGLTVKIDDFSFEVLGADEAKGTALLQTTMSGVFTRTGKKADLSLIHVLEWNQLNDKIIYHLVINKEIAKTLSGYRTKAEQHLWQLYSTLFQTQPELFMDGSAPVWDLLADTVQVKLHWYAAGDILDQTQWKGKEELQKAMKEMYTKWGKKLLIFKDMPKRMKELEMQVLFADDEQVYVKFTSAMVPKMCLVRYVFDEQGLLTSEEKIISGPMYPWQLFPLPFTPKMKGMIEGMKEMKIQGMMEDMQSKPSKSFKHPPMSSTVNIENVENFSQIGHMKIGELEHETTVGDVTIHMKPHDKND